MSVDRSTSACRVSSVQCTDTHTNKLRIGPTVGLRNGVVVIVLTPESIWHSLAVPIAGSIGWHMERKKEQEEEEVTFVSDCCFPFQCFIWKSDGWGRERRNMKKRNTRRIWMEMKESIIFFNNVTSRALLSFPVETGALIVNRSMYRQEKTKAEKTSPFFFFCFLSLLSSSICIQVGGCGVDVRRQ